MLKGRPFKQTKTRVFRIQYHHSYFGCNNSRMLHRVGIYWWRKKSSPTDQISPGKIPDPRSISGGIPSSLPNSPSTGQDQTPSGHHDIFISYSSKDKPLQMPFVQVSKKTLYAAGLPPRDVPPGEDFPVAIIDAIDGSKVMVLIFSANSNILRKLPGS